MSKIEEKVAQKLISRAGKGFQKYGTTMEREDLTKVEWLVHLQEELMDGAVYIEKLLEVLEYVKKENPQTSQTSSGI
jgi:hypothetical protein